MKKFNSIMSIFLVFVITIGMISSFGVFASAVNTTISLDDAVSDSGKNMMKDSSASFTATNGFTEDTKSIIMANNFEETAMGHKYGSATLTREADPSTRTAYAMKFTATPGTGNPRCQLTNNVEWGGDTYSQYGMKDDRTIIAKVDLYLPQEAFDEMTNAMRYELTLGSANIDGIYGLGSVKITKPNPADTTFTANCDTVKRQLTPNTWYNIKYIYQPGASSIKVYLNDELFNTRSVPPENKIMSTSVANGFRFVAVKGTKITNGVYFDNAEIYQMEKLIGIKSMSFNETSGELFIDFETNINASELDKIILKHSNENVTNLITSRRILSNAHNAIL
ncbi:MAG: hypothetical protein RSC29_03805, partial [Oscillospiraceae bacterium]